MKTVTVPKKYELNMGHYRYRSALYPESTYIIYDHDADGITANMTGTCIESYNLADKMYQGENLASKSLLYIMVGDYEDVLFDLYILKSLEKQYADLTLDVATYIDVFMLLQQFGFNGTYVHYPLQKGVVDRYDRVFTNEIAYRQPFLAPKTIDAYYCKIAPQAPMAQPLEVSLNPAIKKATKLPPTTKTTIALHIQADKKMNSGPVEGYQNLIRFFPKDKYRIILTGLTRTNEYSADIPNDFVYGRDRSIFEIISVLSQVDLIIATDSYAAMVGGILGKPTLAILTSMDDSIYALYPSVTVVQSGTDCAPCYRNDACPLGHTTCQALTHAILSPQTIYQTSQAILQHTRLN